MAENERIGAKFTLDINDLKSGIRTANKLIKESQSEFKAAAASMDDWTKSEDGLKAKIKSLQDITSIQQKKVKALTDEYNRLVENGMSPTSDEAVSLRTKINNEKEALAKNEKELQRQKDALNNLSDSSRDASENVDDLKDSAKKSGDGFTVAKGVIANFVTDGLEALINGCKKAVSSLLSLPDSTLQFSKDLKQLEVAFGQAGYSAEETYDAFNYFGSVLGDTRKAQETMLMLSKITSNQQELVGWTDTLTGVFALYGKSIPTEALSEGIVDTIRLGEVQGKLKDALENANVDVADFNKKLKAANTTEKKSALIQDTLNEAYGDAAKQYNELNKEILDASTAETDLQKAQADLGDTMRPVTTEITKLKTELLQKLSPVLNRTVIPLIKNAVEGFKNFANSINWRQVGEVVSSVFNKVGTIIEKLAKVFVPLLQGAFKILAPVIDGVTTAVGWLADGLSTVIGLFADSAESTSLYSERQQEIVNSAHDAADAYRDQKQASDELVGAQYAEINQAQRLWGELQTLVDENGNVKKGYEARVDFINQELNDAFGLELTRQGEVISGYQEAAEQIDKLIEKKKAQILLEAYEDDYVQAVKNRGEAEQARAINAIALEKAETEAKEAKEKAEKRYQELLAEGRSTDSIYRDNTYQSLKAAEANAQRALENAREEYKKSEDELYQYYTDIEKYEKASTLILEDETGKAIEILEDYGNGFVTAKNIIGKTYVEQKKILGEQLEETRKNAELTRQAYLDGVDGVTEEMLRVAEEQARKAEYEYNQIGINITKGIANGITQGTDEVVRASSAMMMSTIDATKRTAQIKSPSRVFRDEVGKMIGAGVAVGIDRSTPTIIGSIKRQSAEMQNAYDLAQLTTNVKNGATNGNGGVTVIQNNNYSKAHSRYEIYKSQQQTAAAVRLAMGV